LKNIQDFNSKLLGKAREDASGGNDPGGFPPTLEPASRELTTVINDLSSAASDAVNNKDDPQVQEVLNNVARRLENPLNSVVDIVKSDSPEARKDGAKKQARVILASLRPKGGAKIDPNNLLKASRHLAGLLADMVGKTNVDAFQGEESSAGKANASLALDQMVADMEISAKKSNSSQSKLPSDARVPSVKANVTVPQPQYRSQSASMASTSSSNKNESSPSKAAFASTKNLEESLNIVASDIKERVGDEKDAYSMISRELATELQQFAKADQENRRQDVLISGRNISAVIMRLTWEIKALSNQCKDVVMKDKLVRHLQALKNFSIQLKILASVRASSSDNSSNNAQLAILARSLGNVLADVSTTLTIARKSKKM